ncbi:MAG: CRISPR-associated protein Cas7 [Bacteroidales bacterium]|nr:CRISPR-associated protein Cas7 [Bacteroidales bacterium]
MSNTIYIRTLKHAEHTVFGVEDGQKRYFDPQFKRYIPYSSGQQVKHSVIDRLSSVLNQQPAPTTFIFAVNKNNELKEEEVYANCDPSFPDQLFGGWMKAGKGGSERTIKRRSPLSISAMRGLHPLLAGVPKENISFDRSDRSNTEFLVRDPKGEILSDDEVLKLLAGKDRSLSRKWIPNNYRATGLFVQDIAIDLRRLFCVSLNNFEPEITPETEKRLREAGWIESENIFGICLVAPRVERERLIPALAEAIIDWTITSNQSRTFSLMETLAVAIGENANKIASSIRAKLSEEEDEKAIPIIEEEIEGVDIFVSTAAQGYIRTKTESTEAMEQAKARLVEIMTGFDYEQQLNDNKS